MSAAQPFVAALASPARLIAIGLACLVLAACERGNLNRAGGDLFAPGIAGPSQQSNLETGHRLMAAGEYDLALRAYHRSVRQEGLNADTMAAIGSANLRLGRLTQAESWLRRAVAADADFPPAWNNLGVALMERNQPAEASEAFRRALASDQGRTAAIGDNLALALARFDSTAAAPPPQAADFQLIRRGPGNFILVSDLSDLVGS